MKLIRYGELHKEKTGIVIDQVMYDTSVLGEDYNENFFETGGLNRLQEFIDINKNWFGSSCKDRICSSYKSKRR